MITDNDLIEIIVLIIYGFIILIFGECIAVSRYGSLSAFIDKNTELVISLGIISLFTVVPCVIGIVETVIEAYKERKELSKN